MTHAETVREREALRKLPGVLDETLICRIRDIVNSVEIRFYIAARKVARDHVRVGITIAGRVARVELKVAICIVVAGL